jgi:SulP family sulfate permease
VINLVGFLEGIGLGIVVSGVLFVISYSRIGVIRGTLSGAEFRSSVIRSPSHERLLNEQSHWTHINKLQGYLFFGTANRLLDQVRASLQTENRPRSIVFDFKMVSGLDSSAVLSFARMRQLAQAHDVALCFSHMARPIFDQLSREVFQGSQDPVCCTFPDLDHAVEWCENRVLDHLESAGVLPGSQTLYERLADRLKSAHHADTLMQYLERQEVSARHIVLRQGDPPRGLFFIESGQITIQLEREGASPLRIRKMSAGTIVGEMGFYLNQPASATVMTDLPSTLYQLSPDSLDHLAREHPDVATAFHASMACFMAERLTQTTRTLQMLVE